MTIWLTNESTNPSTKVTTLEEEVDSESTLSDASRGSTIVANYCDLPDCVEPSRRPHDCAVCQFINWVDSLKESEVMKNIAQAFTLSNASSALSASEFMDPQ
ncbi:MAG: hypothetical protein VXY89_16175, partial [SAR324 cluster bacterium]|nr:hypothetical protein [SAR324 cluster bacterium]